MSKLKQLLFSLNDTDRKTIEEKLKEKDQQIDQLKQQLAEKEKENEELKLKLDIRAMNLQNINTERMEAVRNQTQLAIQELEKIKNKCDGMYDLWLNSKYKENMYNNEDIAGVFEDISVFTNDLIKKLKGE